MNNEVGKTELEEVMERNNLKKELLNIIKKSDLNYGEVFIVLQSLKVELQMNMTKNKLV
jgi:hypothetical protein